MARLADIDVKTGQPFPVVITNNMQIAVKSADESVTNSATLQNDDELVLAMEANAGYIVEADLKVTDDADTSGIKVALNGPAAPSQVLYDAALTTKAAITGPAVDPAVAYATAFAFAYTLLIATNPGIVRVRGYIKNGTTAGNLVVQFACATAAGSGVKSTVKAGSFLRLTKVV